MPNNVGDGSRPPPSHNELGRLDLDSIGDTSSDALYWIGVALLAVVLLGSIVWVLA